MKRSGTTRDKVVAVTGGARGIGKAIAARFTAVGARVAIGDRDLAEAEDTAAELGVHAFALDVTDPVSFAGFLRAVRSELGPIDVLVNNAGIMTERTVADITPGEWDLLMALNLRAPMFLVQAALPHLSEGGGSIVNIGSIEGIGANPEHAAYCAAKAGMHGLTRALAVDLGAAGIRCNAIAPGWIASNLSEAYLDGMPDPAAARRSLDAHHPVGHTGTPKDIGDLAVFLASDQSRFITGETIVADGGRTARLPQPLSL